MYSLIKQKLMDVWLSSEGYWHRESETIPRVHELIT